MGISNRLGEKLPLSAELLIRRVTGDPHSAQWTIKATGLASLFYHGSKQSYLMSSYLLYYHKDRTHLGLAKDTPAGRATEIRSAGESQIQSFPRLGGLHHRYAVAG